MEDLKKIQEFFSKPLEENMSLDDQAKAYFLAKVKSGEIDTLPENPTRDMAGFFTSAFISSTRVFQALQLWH